MVSKILSSNTVEHSTHTSISVYQKTSRGLGSLSGFKELLLYSFDAQATGLLDIPTQSRIVSTPQNMMIITRQLKT